MMEVQNLDFQYHSSAPILRDVGFEVLPGQCLAILGNNGAGKSTLLKCLNRILTPQTGTVYVEKSNILELPLSAVAKQMAFVSQSSPTGRLTVYDMVMLGRKPYIRWGVRREDEAIVEVILERMGLQEMAARFVDELSGGEGQRVMLARALAQQPKVLLLDEPTSNLDLRSQHEVLDLVTRIARESAIAVVMVIHDLNLALRYCQRFLLMKDHRVYAAGGKEIITCDNIKAVYQIPVRIYEMDGDPIVIPEHIPS